jgi:hypothetical protein
VVLLVLYVVILALGLYFGVRNIRRGRANPSQFAVGVVLVVLSALWILWAVTHWTH